MIKPNRHILKQHFHVFGRIAPLVQSTADACHQKHFVSTFPDVPELVSDDSNLPAPSSVRRNLIRSRLRKTFQATKKTCKDLPAHDAKATGKAKNSTLAHVSTDTVMYPQKVTGKKSP